MSQGDYLDAATVAKAYKKPPGTPIRRPIHPKDITERWDYKTHGPQGFCGDDFGAMGACIKVKGHASEDHRDANGYGWTRAAPEKRFVPPVGELRDNSGTTGGSQMMLGDSEAPEAPAVRQGREWRMRMLQSAQFTGIHARFGSQN